MVGELVMKLMNLNHQKISEKYLQLKFVRNWKNSETYINHSFMHKLMDEKVFEIIGKESKRQESTIELIASAIADACLKGSGKRSEVENKENE